MHQLMGGRSELTLGQGTLTREKSDSGLEWSAGPFLQQFTKREKGHKRRTNILTQDSLAD